MSRRAGTVRPRLCSTARPTPRPLTFGRRAASWPRCWAGARSSPASTTSTSSTAFSMSLARPRSETWPASRTRRCGRAGAVVAGLPAPFSPPASSALLLPRVLTAWTTHPRPHPRQARRYVMSLPFSEKKSFAQRFPQADPNGTDSVHRPCERVKACVARGGAHAPLPRLAPPLFLSD